MRTLEIGSQNFTKISVGDKRDQGGICYEYYISRSDENNNPDIGEFGHILFQNGPIKEFGVNGCHQEDLLAIVIDRLRSFQAGEFSCPENNLALIKLEEAMHWLNCRTNSRINRGVEGTSIK